MDNLPRPMILIILLLILISTQISADLGPKPSANFYVSLDKKPVPDNSFDAKMLSCHEKDAESYSEDTIPQLNIEEYDPENDCYWRPAKLAWGGNCYDGNCHFDYFLPSEFMLAIYLPSQDKVYLSDKTTRDNFRSRFEADLLPDGKIRLKDTTPFLQTNSAKNIRNFLIALILTLFLELSVALIYISYKKIPKSMLVTILAANIISLPIIWFIFPMLKNTLAVIISGEIFAFIFESFFIHLTNKKIIDLKRSFLISIYMNSTSLIIGGFIFIILSFLIYI